MGRPIIVDDGGSIRLKLVVPQGGNSKGEMDSLFTITGNSSDHDINGDVHDGPYNKVFIINPQANGNLNQVAYTKAKFEKILITSDLGLVVEFDRKGGGKYSKIKLNGNGFDPVLESKEHNGNRYYAISNAGRISGIDIIDSGGNPTQVPLQSNRLYTSIVIT